MFSHLCPFLKKKEIHNPPYISVIYLYLLLRSIVNYFTVFKLTFMCIRAFNYYNCDMKPPLHAPLFNILTGKFVQTATHLQEDTRNNRVAG